MRGFKLHSDMQYKIESIIGANLTSVDLFVLELMLMVDSTWFFAWGNSAVHSFVKNRRDVISKTSFLDVYKNESLSEETYSELSLEAKMGKCSVFRNNHNVISGKAFGSLPKHLQ